MPGLVPGTESALPEGLWLFLVTVIEVVAVAGAKEMPPFCPRPPRCLASQIDPHPNPGIPL